MTDLDMGKTFETLGSWFLPDTPDRRVAGKLSSKPDRIELELADSLRVALPGPIEAVIVHHAVIHGTTQKQEAVSLFECTRVGYSLTFASGGVGQPETVWSHLAVVGAHLSGQQVYPELRCRIPGLQMWMSPRLIQAVKNDEGYAFRIKKVLTETITISCIDAEIDFSISGVGSSGHSTATMVASGWLHVRPREPQLLSWFLEQLSILTGLLALLAEKPMPPDRIELKPESSQGFVLSVLTPRSFTTFCDHKEHHDFFVSRTRLGDDLGRVVANWFELFPRVELAAGLALSTMASSTLWTHVRFLSFMQALEGLHRALFLGSYMEPEQYEVVKKALVQAIPKDVGADHRTALISRIRYGNEISLAKRLKLLSEMLPIGLRTRILGGEDVPRSWVDTRNYYTHWDEALRSNVLSDQDMETVGTRLACFLRALYLNLTGIQPETLDAAFDGKSGDARYLAQLKSSVT